MTVCHREIYIREEGLGDKGDLPAWNWILQLLETMGPAGISSDDTDAEMETVYRITVQPARRPGCDDIMAALDANHLMFRLTEGKYGRLPVVRRQGDEKSERDAPKGWPRELYNDTWFDSLTARERTTLCVSQTAFEWLNVVLGDNHKRA